MPATDNAVVAACDAPEMIRFMRQSVDWPLPVYIRLAKGGDPVVSHDDRGFTIGKAIVMRQARTARPVVLMATGVMTTNALKAAILLEADGIDVSVVHFHTIKPLDSAAVVDHARSARLVVTVEEGIAEGPHGENRALDMVPEALAVAHHRDRRDQLVAAAAHSV